MATSGYRILVVDDEPLALNVLARVITMSVEEEVILHTTTSPKEAIELASYNDLDVVVSDQVMPEMTGVELLAHIARTSPRSIRMVLTAYPELGVALRAINEAHVHRLLLKPCQPDDLAEFIRQAIAIRKHERDREALLEVLAAENRLLMEAHRIREGALDRGMGLERPIDATRLAAVGLK